MVSEAYIQPTQLYQSKDLPPRPEELTHSTYPSLVSAQSENIIIHLSFPGIHLSAHWSSTHLCHPRAIPVQTMASGGLHP